MTGVVLFAGGGLACHGLEEAGLDLLLGVEWEADAVKVAQATGLSHVIEGDVRDPELRATVRRPGLLWSSFPCQAWSTAGKRLGAQDERNGWPWTVDWIDAVSPRWFIAENVRGLTFHRGEADCDQGARPKPDDCPRCYLDGVILPQLRERFEWVDCRVLNSADFGTPQHRRRLFIVAGPRRISWPAPTHSEGGDLWTKPWRSMGEALGLIGFRAIGGGRNPQSADVAHLRNFRDLTAEPCITLAAEQVGNRGPWIQHGTDTQNRRRLTVQECRVLMNAPQCYDAALDLVSTTAAYRILGNGVDRQLSRLLALAVLAAEQEAQCDAAA
jgi:site-specific DNA-cytosine methylase